MTINSSFLLSRRQLLLVGMGFYSTAILPSQPARATPSGEQRFIMHEAPRPVSAVQFADGEGRTRILGEFRGKVVLVNIWATWCSSCRKEMPALDRLQAALGGTDFTVVALSIDRKGPDVVKQFYAEYGVQRLSLFVDVSGTVMQQLGIVGLPTTLLIDRQGLEVGRLIGPAEWDTPEMIALLKAVVAKQGGAASSPQQKELD